jgi:uncharacterized protein YdhG (YjbR/CyaY superfamily)
VLMMPSHAHAPFLAASTPKARALLEQVQTIVVAKVPGATACVGYGMPAFRQQRIFLYFAAFKKHIGVYPPVTDDADLVVALARYRGPKGNLSFPLSEPLPEALLGRVVVALAAQYAKRPAIQAPSKS